MLKQIDHYWWLVCVLTLIGGVLRFWNLEASQQFLGDQGRDALVVSRIFTDADLVFIGPVTSIGNMYLGPAYYYFMLPFLWLTYPSPMGPIIAMALLGTVTIPVLYWVGSELLNKRAALIATFFYTFSSIVLAFTRFSWNPNPEPLVMLLLLLGVHRALTKNPWYWTLAIGMFSVLIQLHYVTLLAGGVIGVFWVFEVVRRLRSRQLTKTFVLSNLVSAMIFGLSLVPLMLFDWKHNWLNLKALQNIFIKEEAFAAEGRSLFERIGAIADQLVDRAELLFFDITLGPDSGVNEVLLAALFVGVCFGAWKWFAVRSAKKASDNLGLLMILASAGIGVLGLGMYQHPVYIHYITFLFPIAFLVLGFVFDGLLKANALLGSAVMLIFAQFFALHTISTLPYQDAGWQISEIEATANLLVEQLQPGETYDMVLLSSTRDILGSNYRYFLHTTGRPPAPDAERGDVDVLFIIDEEKKADNVTDLPIYEIVVFPNKQVDAVIEIPDGPTITILRREKGVE